VDRIAENGPVLVTQAENVKKTKWLKREKLESAPGPIRTGDLRIRSPIPLSSSVSAPIIEDAV